ncbi:MAG TPA: hypothetical protein VGE77_11135, partial [Nocardioides sp.]
AAPDGEATEAMDADELREAVRATPPARPRPSFDMGDTAEGIITYVVDTGELPAVRAPLASTGSDERTDDGELTQPLAGLRVLGESAPPADEPDGDDPDLLIRFR